MPIVIAFCLVLFCLVTKNRFFRIIYPECLWLLYCHLGYLENVHEQLV